MIKLIDEIDPLSFIIYLKDAGWHEFNRKSSYTKIFWREVNGKFTQVTIPIDKTLNDYKEAMIRALKIVAEADKF